MVVTRIYEAGSTAAWLFSDSSARVNRLTSDPTKKVVAEPIKKYHVYAILVRRHTQIMVISPANMPTSAPLAFERGLSVPKRKSPSRLPNGNAATVSPASRTGPQVISPKPISTSPQNNVMRRDRRRKAASLLDSCLRA